MDGTLRFESQQYPIPLNLCFAARLQRIDPSPVGSEPTGYHCTADAMLHRQLRGSPSIRQRSADARIPAGDFYDRGPLRFLQVIIWR